ncbi:SMI1/KNR4 family protein [Nonomuraea sp. NPDC049709]|uniref:SMI1/KNR4 family protein n=1 Tax=Nonomuraea sp. NPDC049709 TaxID=3154736 RepID=UPI00341CF437
MRRLMTPRTVWLALAAALAAVAAVLTMRRSRRLAATRPLPAQHQDEPEPAVSAGAPAPAPAPAPDQPAAVPLLGTPTASDLRRFAAKPSILDRPPARPRAPREPLSEAVRRRLTRWAVAGCALVLLASCTQLLESAVFSNAPATQDAGETVTRPGLITDEACDPSLSESRATCLQLDIVGEDPPAQEPVTPPPADTVDEDCLPKEATPRVRKIDAKVTRAVNRQWRRIESWLKTHAPRSHRTLGKPGKAADIAAAEAEMGLRFPDDLRASLLRHDGSVFLDDTWAFGFLGNSNAGVAEILDGWRGLCEIDGGNEGDGGDANTRTEWWDGRMLPVGADGMGDHLVVDAVQRDVGTTDHEGSMSFRPGGVRIRSFYALLKATADAMENGTSIGYWKPRAVAGEVEWDVLDLGP